MAAVLPDDPKYKTTMERLEATKRSADGGSEYWFAREIQTILGYEKWQNFETVIERAAAALSESGNRPSHHIAKTSKLMGTGKNAQRRVKEFFLSRAACYLIAMNGDPSKIEIASAQVYFAAQTRAREVEVERTADEKRLEVREKATRSFKAVSGAAHNAGVSGQKQGLFHNARYEGLYDMTSSQYRTAKGLEKKDNPFDHMGVLELSANDFQMNLAAETIQKEGVKSEASAIKKNKEVAQRVRQTMIESGSTPENLPKAEPIKEVRKRVKSRKMPKTLPPNA